MSGVALLLRHPQVASRDCEDCQRWQYDEKTGLVETIPGTTEPLPRADPQLVPCRLPAGCPKGTPEDSRALNERNWRVYQHYKLCRATGAWPDDYVVQFHAAVIDEVERRVDREDRRALSEALWATCMMTRAASGS